MNEKVGFASSKGDEWSSQTASKEQSENERSLLNKAIKRPFQS
jgi:hypothetical protein